MTDLQTQTMGLVEPASGEGTGATGPRLPSATTRESCFATGQTRQAPAGEAA